MRIIKSLMILSCFQLIRCYDYSATPCYEIWSWNCSWLSTAIAITPGKFRSCLNYDKSQSPSMAANHQGPVPVAVDSFVNAIFGLDTSSQVSTTVHTTVVLS